MKRFDNDGGTKRSVFKIEYLLIIVLTIVVIFIFLSSHDLNFSFKSESQNQNNDYVTALESRLENLLSNVKGVGKINAFITVDGSEEEIILKNREEKVVNGVKSLIESAVLVGGKPYVIKTENPSVIGVVIVCEGADDLSVRLSINEIVLTTLKVNSDSVRIIKMK